MGKEKVLVFPSMKKKLEFDEKFNDGSYKFQYSKVSPDGTVTAYYWYIPKKSNKTKFSQVEKQLNLF